MATPAAALEFRDIRKSFGIVPALNQVSFDVLSGEFFGLAGVNGAGKTTLIKCMLDLAMATTGTIRIFGIPSTDYRSRVRLSFLPERFIPPYYLNGRDFLRMMAGVSGDRYEDCKAQAMLVRLDLDPDALVKPVRTYSKGMTQKLGLASCFLADRDLTILDEPMSGLDPKARARVKDILADLKERGRTLFFTSHALADIDEICERIGILHEGELRFVGAPRELIESCGATTLERAFLRKIEMREIA